MSFMFTEAIQKVALGRNKEFKKCYFPVYKIPEVLLFTPLKLTVPFFIGCNWPCVQLNIFFTYGLVREENGNGDGDGAQLTDNKKASACFGLQTK